MIVDSILHNWHIKAICFILALTFVFFTRLNSLKEEPVVVFLDVYKSEDFAFTNKIPTKVTLKLRGEESEIEKIQLDDLGAYIDARDITEEGIRILPVNIIRDELAGTGDNVEITVNPPRITTIVEERVTKYVQVQGKTSGIPSHGYELSSSFINPAKISISGPKSHLEKLETIETQAIDLTGISRDFKTRIKLNDSDPLIEFPEGLFVEFSGTVSETTAIKVIENVNIAFKNLEKGLAIKEPLPQITVHVEGNLLALEDFTKNNIALTSDLSEIREPGEYEVDINHWVPRQYHIFNKSRDSVKITVIESTPPEAGED